MANNCTDCDFCLLVDEDCLYRFSPLPRVPIKDIMPAVLAANCTIDELTGSCTICDDQSMYTALLETTTFKQYYASLVFKNWLSIYGGGQSSASGMIKKAADDLSDFRVFSSKEVRDSSDSFEKVLVLFERKFLEKFQADFPDCEECEDTTDDCDTCESNECGCGCDQCTCGQYNDYDNLGDSSAI